MISELIEKLVAGDDLGPRDVELVMDEIVSGRAAPSQVGAFLIALRIKREKPSELAAFASFMRKACIKLNVTHDRLVDTAGMGGDRSGTINVSTAAALVMAAAGARVAKHGNRAVSSPSGSADLLESMGVKVDSPPEVVSACIEEANFGFVYAPLFHPAMKSVSQIRRELGVRTLFNLLGPLTNPAGVRRQLLGVAERHMVPLFSETLNILGSELSYVVYGLDGVDEVSVCAPTVVGVVTREGVSTTTLDPPSLGLEPARPNELKITSKHDSALAVYRILSGRTGMGDPKSRFVAANAGVGLHVSGLSSSPKEGVQSALETLASGRAVEVLKKVVDRTSGDRSKLEELEKNA
ncbi:MAG: anthranilate phosphoribosyltransferase [Thermoprotei archaeon]